MKLIIGGYAQGKLEYALSEQKPVDREHVLVLDEQSMDEIKSPDVASGRTCVIVNHLHLIIREIADREASLRLIRKLVSVCAQTDTDLTVICDELGCGVIPLEPGDRIYRESVGRILCDLASEAESVIRIVCGIPCRLK